MRLNEQFLLPDRALLTARFSIGMVLGQIYVGPNSLWAPFVTVIVHLMYCLVLCSGFAGSALHMIIFLPHQELHAKITTG